MNNSRVECHGNTVRRLTNTIQTSGREREREASSPTPGGRGSAFGSRLLDARPRRGGKARAVGWTAPPREMDFY
ncbi:hypothetical protein EYF80_067900 [Liparis tanakae]|uniref:Uncharacterized protein n=1 Tax=Liparis tanakae TaxID=230148 RepID=A0A4Z2DZU9_9TELE|nr:hypothetical protein EYF80_067900 [Liparis tanakae]